MKRSGFVSSAVFLVAMSLGIPQGRAAVQAQLSAQSGAGVVEFVAVGRPSLLKIKGKGAGPEGTIEIKEGKVSGVLKFDLETLDTGIGLRTEHMKEKYLETKTHREAQLSLNALSLPSTWSPEAPKVDDAPFTGTMKLHGVEKPVTGTYSSHKTGEGIEVSAKFDLKLSDFNIVIPSYAGITVADQVTVNVTIPKLAPIQKTAQEN